MPLTQQTFTNYGSSAVAGGAGGGGTQLNAGDTTRPVTTGQGTLFPATAPFLLQLGALTGSVFELVQCSARSGDSLTLVRAQEGTSARVWPVGATVTLVLTAAQLSAIESALGNLTKTVYNVRDYGAVGDGVLDVNSAVTATTTALSTTTSPGPFTSAMTGRNALLRGAGAAGIDLWTTVTFVDSQHLTLGAAASITVGPAVLYIVNTNDFAALQAAVTAATAAGGGEVVLPAGVYLMDCRASQATVTNPNGPVRIRGASTDATHLVCSGASASAGSAMLVANAGCSMTVEDLTMVGPTTPNGFYSRGIWQLGTGGYLTVRRVKSWMFETPIEMDAGTLCNLSVEDCELSSHPTLALGTGCIATLDIARMTIDNCWVHDFGVSGSNQNHGLYLTKGADIEVKGCRFSGNRGTGFSIQIFGGSATSPATKISDCFFASDSYQAVLCNPSVRTLVIGCRILSAHQGVIAQGDTDISDCEFDNVASGQSCIVQGGGTPASKVNIRDCYFNTPAATGTNPIQSTIAASFWRVDNCAFTCNQSAAFLNSGGGSFLMINCAFADDGLAHFIAAGQPAAGAPTFSNINANVTAQAMAAGSNDIRGIIQFNVQTATIAAGTRLFTITFVAAYGVTPSVVLGVADLLIIRNHYTGPPAAGSFDVYSSATLAIATGYKIPYLVIG
jgi:hypothetical protein